MRYLAIHNYAMLRNFSTVLSDCLRTFKQATVVTLPYLLSEGNTCVPLTHCIYQHEAMDRQTPSCGGTMHPQPRTLTSENPKGPSKEGTLLQCMLARFRFKGHCHA